MSLARVFIITILMPGAAPLMASAFGCDSSEPAECRLLTEDVYTKSGAAVRAISNDRIAMFELQQEVRTYEDGTCQLPDKSMSEIRLVIRNLSSCELAFKYRLSVFEGRVGSSIEGETLIRQGAANDEGIILRDLGIRIDRSQLIITTSDVTVESCS